MVIGAGFVGSRVAQRWPGLVRVVRRTNAAPVCNGAQSVALDICAAPEADLRTALAGAHAIVCAVAPGRDQDRGELYETAAARIARCAPQDIATIVWSSSTSALADITGVVTEEDDAEPEHERGRVQRRAERQVTQGAHDRGLPSPWLLRFGGLYGHERPLGGWAFRRSEPLPGDGMTPTNLIQVDDAVSAILAALHPKHTKGHICHVVADEHTPRRELYARVAQRHAVPAPRWSAEPGPIHGKTVANSRLRDLLGLSLAHASHDLSAHPLRAPVR